MSRMDVCRLEDSFSGKLILRLTTEEARSMVREGTARRVGKHSYVPIKPVAASNSNEDSPMLTRHDMAVVAGVSRVPTEAHFERLQGWGFRVPKPRPPQNQMAQ